MASEKFQRTGIWVIVIVMTIGTIVSFAAIILSNKNNATDQATEQKAYDDYLAQQKQQAQANADNSVALDGYSAAAFDASSVTSLKVETLVQGDGKPVAATDSINVSYFGWMPDGTIFDSSTKKNTADAPTTFALSGVIPGWTTGLTGVDIGSTVRLTIPAAQAYAANGSGIIPANTPLQFIIEVHKLDNPTS